MKSLAAYFDRSSLVLLALVLGACKPAEPFECDGDSDCVLEGERGVCLPTQHCAYPEDACASGYAYPSGAGPSLAGVCLPPGSIGPATGGAASTSTGTQTGAVGTVSSTSSGSVETDTGPTADPSTSG